MDKKILAAGGAALAALVVGGIVFAVSSDDDKGRKDAIGSTTPGTLLYVSATGRNSGTCASSSTACATVTYALTQAVPGATIKVSGTIHDNVTITKDIFISGADAPSSSPAVLDGSSKATVVNNGYFTSTLDHIRIEHGKDSRAAGISNQGPLTLSYTTVQANTGTGIWNWYGTLTIKNSTITGNATPVGAGYGGGMYTGWGQVTITDSTISGNKAPSGYGGGLLVKDGGTKLVTISRSTISGNVAGTGGGIMALNPIKLVNSTMTGNSASDGGAIWASAKVDAYATTIVGNTALSTANVFIGSSGTATFAGSIVASNSGGNCTAEARRTTDPVPFVSHGYNLTQDTGAICKFLTATDLHGVSTPGIGALASNGGPTKTMLPSSTSPARNKIPAGMTIDTVPLCAGTDQRSYARPKSGATKCAIGSVEP